MFFASVDSAMLAKGLSAPQHSTYLVILLEGRDLVGGPLGVAMPYMPSPQILLWRSDSARGGFAFPFCASDSGFWNLLKRGP